ncbi:cytochrome c oxidase assembly protein subunit 15 [Agromyces flavus]|uniref:Cytochrome c oxidase assembly protein subunit 15 n=1 Tax=Agromyces flavus TaxID=589382 RepID=A0A1H1R425_9MICO|nr:COX15/CtaA family protein [Agromyces flavus]MCP2367623.1 cytochrome c oxidase assembly protein subunit 15 [Agromyces flavus]GGI47067.1 cytochrome b561 [Agromyces flavus]SDS30497.1 cytochrome c oxidase assembly protein subunit 15 [Agromyces flavus]
MNRVTAWLPDRIDRRVRVVAWLSFLAQTIIIATGGAVRLTGSGLGCPTWPLCTEGSLVTTPEMGIHGMIEFGNRLMTGVVGIVAVLVVLSIWRIRRERRDLWTLAVVVVLGIVAQAIVGGITVWTGLNPFIVGFHYVASLVLVCVTAAYLVRLDAVPGPRELAVPSWYAGLTHATTAVLAVSIVFGVLTTASGPHSGDADAGRTGYNAELLEHVHAWPGYALFVLTLVLLVGASRLRLPVRRWVVVLLLVEVVQIAVGLYQARNGLPPLAVGVHMVLAALTAATMTVLVLKLKRPTATAAPAGDAAVAASAR